MQLTDAALALDPQVAMAGQRVSAELLWGGLLQFAARRQAELRYYDGVADGPAQPTDGVDLRVLGRLTFTGSPVRADEAAGLLAVQADELWQAVPADATLVAADPEVDGGLYDAAEAVHRAYLAAVPRLGSSAVSATLALCRPALFPVLSPPLRLLYGDEAAKAWAASPKSVKPYSGHSFWPVLRADIVRAEYHLAQWRDRLADGDTQSQRWLARVSDVRLWGIVASYLGQTAGPG